MAEKEKKSDSPEAVTPSDAGQAAGGTGQGAAARQRVEVNDQNVMCSYANFCRVTGTPEELILDFGLNSQPFGAITDPVNVSQRIVTNYFTAKRMLHALQLSVARHEQAFGVLETDVQKRVVGKPPAAAQPT